MTFQPLCELYCAGGAATQHQIGHWPDTYACDACRILWDVLCSHNPVCQELAAWHMIDNECWRHECLA
jgi:hypothetical protein